MKKVGFLASTAMATLAFVAVSAIEAKAAGVTVTFTSVTGTWTSVTGGFAVTGLNTSEIRWGSGVQPRSGYGFTGGSPGGPFEVDEVFTAGTFTHFNRPIGDGTSITGAVLEVNFQGTIQNGAAQNFNLTSTFNFDHLETPNPATPCADGGANGVGVNVNGCADRVTFALNPSNSETVNIDGTEYLLTLTGFVVGDNPPSEFWTVENRDNEAIIQGTLTASATPVPIPAALPLMVSGLAALGWIGVRRRSAR